MPTFHLHEHRSTLQNLRQLIPSRDHVTFSEALRVAELQATRLLALTGGFEFPVSDEVIAGLPRVRIEYVFDLPAFGLSFWDSRCWVIQIGAQQSTTRQRFTLFHEYKHIIDHHHVRQLYRGTQLHTSGQQAELAADYFAGCALVPRRALKHVWGELLIQEPSDIARYFGVSREAAEVRLHQTGLRDRIEQHTPPIWPKHAAYGVCDRSAA